MENEKWEVKALKATHNQKTGEQTMLGAILRAAMGKQRGGLPRYGDKAVVTNDGFVIADFTSRDGTFHPKSYVCTTKDLEGEFRSLADYLKFSEDERTSLFKTVVQWIARDYRAKSNLEEAHLG